MATDLSLLSTSSSVYITSAPDAGSGLASSTVDDIESLKEQLETTRLVVQKILIPCVVAFGVTGNLVNVAVLTRRWMKSSTNSYLTALAIYDVLYLLLALSMTATHYDAIRSASWYQRYKIQIGRPLTDTASNTGVWLTLTFTVERYIGVCHPMKGKVWCTPERARAIVVFVCLAAAIVTMPEFFDLTVVEVYEAVAIPVIASDNGSGGSDTTSRMNFATEYNSTSDISSLDGSPSVVPVAVANDQATNRVVRLIAKPTAFGSSAAYSLGYKYANQALFTFVPLILLLVFNTLLISAVLTAARRRQSMAKTGRRDTNAAAERQDRQRRGQQKITVMLISVVIVFLLCQLPQAIQALYYVYLEVSRSMDEKKKYLLRITGNVFNLLVVVNCSTNFVLYSSFSSKFRMTFRRLFCRAWMCSRPDRKQLDDDAIEMSRANEHDVTVEVPVESSPYSRRNKQAQLRACNAQVAVVVTADQATDSAPGSRKSSLSFASRLKRTLSGGSRCSSSNRKPKSVAVTSSGVSMTTRYRLSVTERCQSGSSLSEAAALVNSACNSDSAAATANGPSYSAML